MSKIGVGDKVRILYSAYSPLRAGSIHVIHGFTTGSYRIKDPLSGMTWYFSEKDLQLVEKKVKKVKKYKLETELSLQQVYQLHCLTGQFSNMTRVYMETERICVEELGLMNFPTIRYDGNDFNGFQEKAKAITQEKAKAITKKGKRKVVVVGDKEYYEDELQTALANIKPL